VQNILIIDDDPAGTQLLMTLLGLEGYQPHSLENWRDPVSDVELHRPDLVIMDIYLRTKDGFELLGELRRHLDPAVARTPVLMMSAEDHRVRCRQEGANGFLEKPFRLRDLVAAIREIGEGCVSGS
jgi:DNA-binding response OmpR family regulator